MAIQLVVTHPFAGLAIGAHVTDPTLVAKYSASHPEYVVRKPLEETAASQPSIPAPASAATPSPASAPSSPASPTVPVLKPIN